MIIILSSPEDPHLPFVTNHLTVPYVVIDAVEVLKGKELSFYVDDEGVRATYDDIPLENVTAIWRRRPRDADYDLKDIVESRYVDYSADALRRLTNQLYGMYEDALWVSDHYAIRKAENKVMQLNEARKIGFLIPPALFTSSRDSARKFVAEQKYAIVKTLANKWPEPVGGVHRAFYAKAITDRNNLDYDGLDIAPAIFQKQIHHDKDIRVTVIGNKVFAAEVHLSGAENMAVRDWRIGHAAGSLKYVACDLPLDIERRCIEITKKLGLNFGAIDLIRDINGQIWFIEINPNGQWAFIEQGTGQEIGLALAALLESREI